MSSPTCCCPDGSGDGTGSGQGKRGKDKLGILLKKGCLRRRDQSLDINGLNGRRNAHVKEKKETLQVNINHNVKGANSNSNKK
ncbi:hypothetical protein YC2023_060172 [Brassica napus]